METEVPAIGRNWWLFVALGVICLATAIAAMVWPDITLLALGVILGIYLMIAAVLEIIDALTGDPGGRAMSAIIGVVALIAGLICFRRPGESLLAIIIAIGIYLIASGVFRIVRALGSTGARWMGVSVGALEAAVGILILAWPKLGLGTLAVIFALTMLMRGIVAIWIGLRLRKASDEAATPAEQTATFA